MKESTITKWTIILSGTFYICSLTQPAYCTSDCKSSLMALLVGLLGVLTEMGAIASFVINKITGHETTISNDLGATFTWLANPAIIFSLLIFKYSKQTAFVLSTISTILILLFLTFNKVVDSEAGNYSKITELKLGYWLWLLSSLTILTGSILIIKLKRPDQENKTPYNNKQPQ